MSSFFHFRSLSRSVSIITAIINEIKFKWKWPRQESNLDLELRKLLYYPLYDEAYLINPGTLLLKIFTAMASNITPKNLRMATIPPGPRIRSIKFNDFKTIKYDYKIYKYGN